MQTITITIKVPETAGTVSVDVDDGDDSLDTDEDDRTVDSAAIARTMIEDNARPREARYQLDVLARIEAEFGIVATPPSSGSRPYLNLFPRRRYGSARVGAINTRSSRFYAVCDLSHMDDVPGSEPAEGKYLTVYLKSEADVERALELMRLAMRERGWEEPT